jgi:hypothetical protein
VPAGSRPTFKAGSTDTSSNVYLMQVYIDGVKQYRVYGSSVSTSLSLSTGTHRFAVQAYDKAGNIFKSVVYATVQ